MSEMDNGIEFIDRRLKPDEKYHHRCKCCRQFIHPDMVQSHKCGAGR